MASHNHDPAYAADLAYVHDVGAGDFAEKSAPGLLRLFRDSGIDDGLIVDLGCGGGIWAGHLVDAGYEVVGVDISPAMIEIARRRAPQATFHVSSCLDCELPSCRAVTALGEVLAYLFDKRNSARGLARLCRRVYNTLPPGGLFVFDLPEVGLHRNRPGSFITGDDWACLVKFQTDDKRQVMIRHIVTFRQSGQLYRRSEETHRMQLYRSAEVSAMLRKIGFRVRTVRKYGDYPLLEKRVGFIARRPR